MRPARAKVVANRLVESQEACPRRQVLPEGSQLQLLAHRSRHALDRLHDLQYHSFPAPAQRPSTVGAEPADLAPDHSPFYRMCFVGHLHLRLLLVLEGRTQEG